jgi:hypothetical protein
MRPILLILIAVIALGGCTRCEDDAPKPDPCAKVAPASALFMVQDVGTLSDDTLWDRRTYDTDTLVSNSVRFVALDGSDPIAHATRDAKRTKC